ncbi:MAG: twin transmembrane helix small protein [Micavibrio sp.]
MSNIFIIMMIIAMLATLGALGLGLFAMVKGGEFNKKNSNKMMQLRVMLQGLALFFFVLAWMTSK